MNNTALGILSALFILVGSWVLSWTNFRGEAVDSPTHFSFIDGAFKTKSVDAFSFQEDGIFATIPMMTSGEFKKIAAHFKSNENRTLSLVGNYYAAEKYTGDSNLGKERAEAIKAILENYGAAADRIITFGRELAGEVGGKKIYNAVIFVGNEKAMEEIAPIEVEKPFSILDPFTVKFDYAAAKPKMTDELRYYLDLALAYIKDNPAKILMVTGCTGTQENPSLNFSKKSAQIVRRLLRVNGVRSRKVKWNIKDEANEISSNETEAGDAKDRRVEITIE
jgi:outer membrane protein OmpA-like peptidoglycan-associated protein